MWLADSRDSSPWAGKGQLGHNFFLHHKTFICTRSNTALTEAVEKRKRARAAERFALVRTLRLAFSTRRTTHTEEALGITCLSQAGDVSCVSKMRRRLLRWRVQQEPTMFTIGVARVSCCLSNALF
jgi:hypothetical protein